MRLQIQRRYAESGRTVRTLRYQGHICSALEKMESRSRSRQQNPTVLFSRNPYIKRMPIRLRDFFGLFG